MTEPTSRSGHAVRRRMAVWVALALIAAATALYWGGQRRARSIDATAELELSATLTADGSLNVVEDLVVATRKPSLTRVLVADSPISWGGVTDGRDRAVDHTTVPVNGGLAVTVPLDDGAPTVVTLHYSLVGSTSVGRDAVELEWNIVDDRNAVAIERMRITLEWEGEEPAHLIDLQAPGVAATVVPTDGTILITSGPLPAHHDVEVHAALPLTAVPSGMVEDRSVMDEMAAAAGPPAADRGGGPRWLPLVIAGLGAVGWGVAHHRVGRDPEVAWPGFVVERPSDHSPAELGWVLRRGMPGATDVTATLADLLARGALEVDAAGTWHQGRQAGVALVEHETVLVRWLLDGVTTIAPADVATRVALDPGRWRGARRAFITALERNGRLTGLVPRRADAESVLGAGVAAAALLIAGVVGTSFGQRAWLVCVVAGAFGLVFSDSLAVVSAEGADLRARWGSYASWLSTDDRAAGAFPGHALVLGARDAVHEPQIAAAAEMADAIQHAFVTATSFVSAPRRRTGRQPGRGR